VLLLAGLCVGWSSETIEYVAWSAVEFFPDDLERQVRRHHKRFDAGIKRGLEAPPSWRAASPGSLDAAIRAQVELCANALRKPVPLDDLVEELGVLAVRVLDASDPLAVSHGDPREPAYAGSYQDYVDSVRGRVRLVYYGQDHDLIYGRDVGSSVDTAIERSQSLYPYVGQEFYRTGTLRDWRGFDDRSVAFGVAAISLSRGLTDLANFAAYVWRSGGGQVPTPRPTPTGHVGPTVTLALEGGFPDRGKPGRGAPAMPKGSLTLPPP
jgi:hypothetical protein